jgi:hypothetical protein
MLNKDNLILETYERKNELESLSYKWKEFLNTTHQEYAKPEDIPAIIKLLEENSEWLYSDGQHSTRGAYTERIDKIKAKINPIKNRYDNFHKILEEINNFFGVLDANFHLLNSLVTFFIYFRRQNTLTSVPRKDRTLSTSSKDADPGFKASRKSRDPKTNGKMPWSQSLKSRLRRRKSPTMLKRQ